MNSVFVPGRPVPEPGKGCPFCLQNGHFKGEMIAETDHGYAGQVAPDLVLVCPREHEGWGLLHEHPFAGEFFTLVHQALASLDWESYNLVGNIGFVAGERIEGHPHFKIIKRIDGQPASSWGMDALIKLFNGEVRVVDGKLVPTN